MQMLCAVAEAVVAQDSPLREKALHSLVAAGLPVQVIAAQLQGQLP